MSRTPQEGRRHRRFRLIVRCCVLATAVLLVLPVLPWPWTPMVLPALSPHILVCSAIATRAISAATLAGLPVLVIVLVRRRWFCRYACPVGLLAEQVGRLRSSGKPRAARLPHLGRWIVLVTLGGACFGYPLFLWMDPLAIFNGVFSLEHDPLSPAGQISAAALAAILNISLLLPGAWCTRICPLGAMQDLLALPQRLFRLREPSAAAAGGRWPVSRRSVLSTAVGAACLGLGARWAGAASGRSLRDGSRLLRPPGSVDEARFAGLCVRCGSCVRACPAGILQPDPGSRGIAGFLAPTVSFAEDYCREDCHRCTQVCPSGAIARLSLEEKKHASIGVAKVDKSLCLLAEDRECDICVRVCPYEAIRKVWSEEDYVSLPQVDSEKCPGCGACEVICPGTNQAQPQTSGKAIPLRKAIEVHPRRCS